MSKNFVTIIGVAVAASLGQAVAGPFNLNTGVDLSGNQLPANSPEQRYSVSGAYSAAAVYPNSAWPILGGPWVPNFSGPGGGQWISPVDRGGFGQAVGITTFSMAFWVPFAQNVTLQFTADNPGQVSLNGGVLFSQAGWPNADAGTYRWLDTVVLSLQQGNNKVSFDVSNLGGPAGLIVNSDSFVAPDNGATLALLGLGLAGVAFARRSMKT
jgi:VPDSG-CTERM motif